MSTNISIDLVFVVASDVLRIELSSTVLNNIEYSNIANYTLQNLSGGSNGIVVRVIPVDDRESDKIYLEVKNMSNGSRYKVTITNNIMRTASNSLVIFSAQKFTMHKTKVDSGILSFPRMYNTNVGSTLRGLIEAMMISDDQIGGDF